MNHSRWAGWPFLVAGCVAVIAVSLIGSASMGDFRTLYMGARCLWLHQDPYHPGVAAKLFLEQAASSGDATWSDPGVVAAQAFMVYPPNALAAIAPIALLPWNVAHWLWLSLLALALMLAAFTAWRAAPSELSAILAGAFLFCAVSLPALGNIAPLIIALTLVAVHLLIQGKHPRVAVVLLALALLLKPHTAGMLWLFFVLAGGVYRKRALQSAVLCVALSLPGLLWVSHVAPEWRAELTANLRQTDAPGGLSDPRLTTASLDGGRSITSLTTVFSYFTADARAYQSAAWLVCAPLLLFGGYLTWRRPPQSSEHFYLGLAAVAALSLLPVYHRTCDAKLLFLCIPACTLLLRRKRAHGVLALGFTVLAVFFTTEAVVFSPSHAHAAQTAASNFFSTLVRVVQERPAPLSLLAVAVVLLYLYARRTAAEPTQEAEC